MSPFRYFDSIQEVPAPLSRHQRVASAPLWRVDRAQVDSSLGREVLGFAVELCRRAIDIAGEVAALGLGERDIGLEVQPDVGRTTPSMFRP
jgi:hypothetical protein